MKPVSPQLSRIQDPSRAVKEDILRQLLRIILIVGAPVMGLSMYLAWTADLHAIFWLDGAAYILVLAVSRVRDSTVQVSLLVALSFGVGGFILFATGAQGAGYVWFVFAGVISVLFGKVGFPLGSLALSLAIFLAYGICQYTGILSHEEPIETTVVLGANTLAVTAMLSGLIYQLGQKNLEVMRKNQSLVGEMQHRIRNNLQILRAAGKINPVGEGVSLAQIQAAESVNDLIDLSNPSGAIDTSDLLEHYLNWLRVDREMDVFSLSLPRGVSRLYPGDAIPTAIVLSDILEACLAWLDRFGGEKIRIELREGGVLSFSFPGLDGALYNLESDIRKGFAGVLFSPKAIRAIQSPEEVPELHMKLPDSV